MWVVQPDELAHLFPSPQEPMRPVNDDPSEQSTPPLTPPNSESPPLAPYPLWGAACALLPYATIFPTQLLAYFFGLSRLDASHHAPTSPLRSRKSPACTPRQSAVGLLWDGPLKLVLSVMSATLQPPDLDRHSRSSINAAPAPMNQARGPARSSLHSCCASMQPKPLPQHSADQKQSSKPV